MADSESASVETLQMIADAFNRHDLDAIMEFFAEDCSMDLPRGPDTWGQRLVGKVAVREGVARGSRGSPMSTTATTATG